MSGSRSSANQSAQEKSQWDAGRFLNTLGYFGEIPFLGSFRWLQQLLGQNAVMNGTDMSSVKMKVTLLGDISTQRLETIRQHLCEKVELSTANPDISFSELENIVRSIDVIVVLNLGALRIFKSRLMTSNPSEQVLKSASWKLEQFIFDFSRTSSDASAWGALDDVVMGGVSKGSLFLRPSEDIAGGSVAVFAGTVSTDNAGGFSSVRTKNFEPPFNFAGWAGVQLRVKGDGQRYKFILRNSSGWDSPAYIYSFDTVASEWQTVTVPFEDMVPTFRAKSMPNAPKLDPQKVFSFQVMLSKFEYDKRLNPSFVPGPFELAIANISVYRPRQSEPLLIVSDEAEPRPELDDLSLGYRSISVDSKASDKTYAEAIAQALL